MIKVIAAVIEQAGEILVCKRSKAGASGGKWEFPGGKLEPGETERECLKRELKEELGIIARIGERLIEAHHQYEAFAVEIVFYRAEVLTGAIQKNVHDDIQWVQRKMLPSYNFLEADVEVVRQIAEGIL